MLRKIYTEDGGHYVLNGAKTFITGGVYADRVIVCTRTVSPTTDNRRHGISLFVVDATSPGFTVGRKLDKLGLKTSDTAELSFVDVQVPAEELLRQRDAGFFHLADNLPRERLTIAQLSYSQARAAVEFAREYTTQRGLSAPRCPRSRTPSSNWQRAAPTSMPWRQPSTARWKPTTPAN